MEPRIQYAQTEDGVSIAFATLGEGTPLVMLPSLPFSHIQLELQSPENRSWNDRLAEKRMLVRYDSRGCGLSEQDVTDFSLDAMVLDLEAVVNHLKLERFALLGAHFAGLVAVAYAARSPDRVSHLVLWCSFARGSDFLESPQIQGLVGLIDKDWELYAEAVAHARLGWTAGEQASRFASLIRDSTTPEALRLFLKSIGGFDVTALLPLVTPATLVLHRRQVPLPNVGLARVLASRIPDARLIVLEGASMFPTVGDVDSFLRAIDEFLDESEATTTDPSEPGAFRTILFTDVEGSTALTDRLGDAKARDLLRQHERVVRAALKEHGGSEVKTLGDGFMASFSSATKALECAIAIQSAFAERNETAQEPIKVRIGLNAGEPIAEDDDLFGASVNRAARIAAMAQGGEILVANVVRELTEGKEFMFGDRGETALRGFDDPVRLFEVRWRDGALGEAAPVMTKSKVGEDFWLEPGAPEFRVDPGPHEPTAETVKLLMTFRQTAGDEVKPVIEWSGANVDPCSPQMMPENQRPGARYQKYQLKPALARPAPPEDEVAFDIRFRWQGATRQYRWRWPLYIREKGIWGMNNTAENVLEPAERTTLD